MNLWNDNIHRAMAHPVKRKIVESLRDNCLSFSELLQSIGDIDHGMFGYHLRGLKGFIKIDPTTKKYCLTRNGKFLNGCIQDFRFIISVKNRSSEYAKCLGNGPHAICLCPSNEHNLEVPFSFLKAGLLKGEAVSYFASEYNQSLMAKRFLKSNLNDGYLHNGTFTISSAYDWYLEKGKAQSKIIIANWNELRKTKRKVGFTGLRVVGETHVFFDYEKVEMLLKYEEMLGRQFDMDFSAICIYNNDKLNSEQFSRLSSAHTHIISDFLVGETLE